MSEDVMEVLWKVFKKQRYISSDEDLGAFGYKRNGVQNETQVWERKDLKDARNEINNPKRIRFGEKRKMVLDEPMPDETICVCCGITNDAHKLLTGKRLSFHHDAYSEDEPLRYTRILCISCHMKLHRNEKRLEIEDY